VIHIDTGWFNTYGNNDLRFDPERFPDVKAMTDKLRKLGFHVSLWQTTNVGAGNALYKELEAIGGMARRSNGQPYIRPGYAEECGLIDYTNPQTIELLTKRFRELFDMGISVIKVDFGEGSPVDGNFYGYDGYAMRNLYALIYNQALFKMTEDYFGEGNGVIWARSTWAGSQRYPVHWSGDGVARWEDIAGTLRSGLSFGLSGFVFWSHDIGGFTCVPSEELYARWVQFGAFSSHSRAHGEPPREPWKLGPTAEAVYRQFMELRYRLLPYIYSQAVECVSSGLPMLRAMVIDFQNDPTAAFIDDQYLFGDSFLVAPIMMPSGQRRVYLPPGEWVDYWTKETVAGGEWLDVDVPLETLPLWVKAGAVVPMGPLQQYVGEKTLDPLTIELYAPGEAGEFVIHDQENIRVAYRREGGKLVVEVGKTPGAVEVMCYGVAVHGASVNGQATDVSSGRVSFNGQVGAIVEFGIG
jgi:alpha-D-xyloside xylohydrolase